MDIELRTCRYCKEDKPSTEFEVANIIDGKRYLRRKCKNCYTQTKAARRSVIRNWLWDYKKNLKCKKCGISDYRVLDFHHHDPSEKEICVASAVTGRWAIDRIQREIDKCEVLCSNCHRIVHWELKNSNSPTKVAE